MESLRAQARSGSSEAVAELRQIIAEEVSELEERGEEAWNEIEEPQLQDWRSGLSLDLSKEGERLHRYEAAADRLFRSAWTKLERIRKERGEPLIHRSAHMPSPRACPFPAAASGAAARAGSPAKGPGTSNGAPAARHPGAVAARRSGRKCSGHLGLRLAPSREQPRRSFPEQDEPDARAGPRTERHRRGVPPGHQARKPAVASPRRPGSGRRSREPRVEYKNGTFDLRGDRAWSTRSAKLNR